MSAITLVRQGKGSLALNVVGHKSIQLNEGEKHTFNSANDYKPYAAAAQNWKSAGLLDIVHGDAPAAPKKEVKAPKVEAPKEEKKEEVKVEAPAPAAEEKAPEVAPRRRGRAPSDN